MRVSRVEERVLMGGEGVLIVEVRSSTGGMRVSLVEGWLLRGKAHAVPEEVRFFAGERP